jgi:hypothetical protein
MSTFQNSKLALETIHEMMGQVRFVSLLYSILAVQSAAASSDGRKRFHWSASVDRKTGVAQSQEVSYPSRLRRCKDRHGDDSYDDTKMKRMMIQCFLDYPRWLCKGSVTLGLLRAVPCRAAANGRNANDDAVWDLQLTGIGTSMLALGKPTRRSNVVQFPFQGGLLVAQNQGCLRFAVTDHGVIETNVVDYRPRLLSNPPVHALRAVVYQRTQTLVHAYVMWRFHRYCRHCAAVTTVGAAPPSPPKL